ncbi:hypothetical protein SUGI_0057560 [Cryptomeria japonica]|nr:hypothetical protein SUGI_0057560 [Cryptomeria japonica]
MAKEMMKPVAAFILVLNLCMYIIVCATAGWALNKAIEHEIITGLGIPLPNPYWAVYFPMGNAATGFFIIFALIAGVVGAASCLSGLHHLRTWTGDSLVSAALTAWGLTLLAMGLACKEIDLHGRNSRLKTVESFVIILSVTQLLYVAALIQSHR